jgi:Rieske Fe-S protein
VISRRRFLGGLSAAGAGTLLFGCQQGGSLDGTVSSVNGVATLTFSRYPALQMPGGGAVVDSARGPLAVLRTGPSTAVAMAAVCTHQGCTLEYSNGPLYCPCHGAEFDQNSGAAIIGPARAPLKTWTATVETDGIAVMLG